MRAGCDLGDPQREAVRGEDRLDVAAVLVGLPGVPQVDEPALHADGLNRAPVGLHDLAIQDHVRQSVVDGALQRLVQVRSLGGQHRDALVQVAVGGGAGDLVVTAEPRGVGAVPEPAQHQHRLPEAGQRPGALAGATAAALGARQTAVKCTSSRGTSSVAR
jgi:hypothetical protein